MSPSPAGEVVRRRECEARSCRIVIPLDRLAYRWSVRTWAARPDNANAGGNIKGEGLFRAWQCSIDFEGLAAGGTIPHSLNGSQRADEGIKRLLRGRKTLTATPDRSGRIGVGRTCGEEIPAPPGTRGTADGEVYSRGRTPPAGVPVGAAGASPDQLNDPDFAAPGGPPPAPGPTGAFVGGTGSRRPAAAAGS